MTERYIYIILYFSTIIFCCLDYVKPFSVTVYYSTRTGKKHRLCFFYWCMCSILLILAVIRLESIGTDSFFNKIAFTDVLNGNIPSYEKGYIILIKAIQLFTSDFSIFISMVSIITLIPIFVIFNKSKQRDILLPIFVSVNYLASFSILRCYLSIMCLIVAFYYIEKKDSKYLSFVYTLLAILFHNVAIIYVAIYFFCKYMMNKMSLFFIITLSILTNMTVVQNLIKDLFHAISGRYVNYMTGNEKISTVYVLLLFFAVFISYIYQEKLLVNKKYNLLARGSFCLFIFALFMPWFPNYSRVISCSFPFFALLLSYIGNGIRNKNSRLLYKISIYFMFLIYMGLNSIDIYATRF